MRVLAASLWGHVGHGTLQDLEQRLLDALPGDVAGDGGVLVLAADLIDFVYINNALLAALHVPIGGLQQLQNDILDVFANVSGFGQGGGVHDGERHIQNLGQGLRHKSLAGAGGTD